MIKQTNELSIIAKIILAFTLFSSFLFMVNTFFSKKIPSQEKEINITNKEESFFYQKIGKYDISVKENMQRNLESKYTLEFDIKNSQDRAIKKIDELAQKGITAYYTPLNNNGKVIYRIRKGVFPNSEEAKKVAKKIEQSQKIKTKVIKL